ncbi:MAG: C1 family peptidase [Spongiibacteraceae bacterium]
MPTITHKQRTFDARPDRIDLRDRMYQPKLTCLPQRAPDIELMLDKIGKYAKQFILDQGKEGACTGFGLAATINYLQWRNNNFDTKGLQSVSPRMIYHLAKLYDEWAGEDYEGSSCRGAMKGWHRHGVCTEALWPYRDAKGRIRFLSPKSDWALDAALRPLGAYYRIDIKSIVDMQSAILEVGAVYVSASVHDGWYLDKQKALSVIPFQRKRVGGHAFAIVGYNEDGFIVQNSWGPDWGYFGFAILSYEDWVHNGDDAWVAVLGAPMRVVKGASAFTTASLQEKSSAQARQKSSFTYSNKAAEPIGEGEAYFHTVVLDNNGIPINKILIAENAIDATEHVALKRPLEWLKNNKSKKIALYVHGGLNSEADSITRVQFMAPYFLGNGIYPIFITWKTGAWESIVDILQDSTSEIFRSDADLPDASVLDKLKEKLAEARDRAIEAASERILVKPIWSQIKQNADAAASGIGGIKLLADLFVTLKQQMPDVEIHLAGHSAGSIVLGHLLSQLQNLTASTLTLFAPACTVEFANKHYGDAIASGRVTAKNFHVDIMDDERELADSVGPYGKSLLYLVSRALESYHKMPLLGMEGAWNKTLKNIWARDKFAQDAVDTWLQLSTGTSLRLHNKSRKFVSTGSNQIRLAHGSFDNDVEVITQLIERIRGKPLAMAVENLTY